MKRLELKNAAYSVAYATTQQTLVAVDAAMASKAAELQLAEPQYKDFRNDVTAFRALLLPAYQQDQQEAARAKTAAANAPKPAPAQVAAPAVAAPKA
jgi:hypothetical protein